MGFRSGPFTNAFTTAVVQTCGHRLTTAICHQTRVRDKWKGQYEEGLARRFGGEKDLSSIPDPTWWKEKPDSLKLASDRHKIMHMRTNYINVRLFLFKIGKILSQQDGSAG